MSSAEYGMVFWLVVLIIILATHTDVSRNRKPKPKGAAWEQDAPWPECFEEDDL